MSTDRRAAFGSRPGGPRWEITASAGDGSQPAELTGDEAGRLLAPNHPVVVPSGLPSAPPDPSAPLACRPAGALVTRPLVGTATVGTGQPGRAILALANAGGTPLPVAALVLEAFLLGPSGAPPPGRADRRAARPGHARALICRAAPRALRVASRP